MFHLFWLKNTRRTPVTLTWLNKVIVQQILNLLSEILQFHEVLSIRMLFNLDLNSQCQHPDSFDLSLLEYQEISAHIQESTFSIHRAEFDPDVIVSCQDLLKYQNSEVLSK